MKLSDYRDGRRGWQCGGDVENRKSLYTPLNHLLKNLP